MPRETVMLGTLLERQAVDRDSAVLQATVVQSTIERFRHRVGDVQIAINVILKPRSINAVCRMIDLDVFDQHRGHLRAERVVRLPKFQV